MVGITGSPPAGAATTTAKAKQTRVAPHRALHYHQAKSSTTQGARVNRTALAATPRLATSVARTFTVDTLTDSHDASTSAAACADSSGKCSLRAAIEQANADTGATEIILPAGTYTLSLGELNPTADMFITGAGSGVTTIKQDGSNRVFDVSGGSTQISGVTITGGGGSNDGTGVYVTDAALTLSNDAVTGNSPSSSDDGAGAYVDWNGSLWVVGGSISKNTTTGDGGGLYQDGAAYLSGVTVSGNSAGYGGGIDNEGNIITNDVTVSDNTANYEGGGVYEDYVATINGGSITGNKADYGTSGDAYGGGLVVYYPATVTGTTISGNTVRGEYAEGGGIYADDTVNLDNVTVTGNQALSTYNGYDAYGAGIANEYMMQMTGGSVTDNTATYDSTVSGLTGAYVYGAGIYNDGENSSFNGVKVTGNKGIAGTDDVEGAGVLNYYAMTFENGVVDNNTATGDYVYGAGFYSDDYTILSGDQINGNSATAASEIYGAGLEDDYYVQMQDVTVNGSKATVTGSSGDIYGGGAYFDDETTLKNVSVNDTVAKATGTSGSIYGGGVYNYYPITANHLSVVGTSAVAGSDMYGAGWYNDDIVNLTNSVVASNTGDVTGASGTAEGGGLYQYYNVNYINVTIADNSVTASGGGTADYGAAYIDDTTQMTNVTVAGNKAATDFGGIYVDSDYTATLKNTIVSANTSPKTGNCAVNSNGQIISAGWNLDSGNTCGFTNQGDQVNTNPMLGALQNNGGDVLTMALQAGSPAIDAGTDTGCPPTDARGFARPFNGRCDIGAFEYVPAEGYRIVASDGGVFSYDAPFYGSLGGVPLTAPIVGMATDPVTGGYWLVAADGGVFAFHAPFYGSMGGEKLNQPIVGIAAAPHGNGYWLVAKDGGVFGFGPGAPFYGSMGGVPLTSPVVGIAADAATGGYWLAAADGGIFAFHAPFLGSTGGQKLVKPVVGIASNLDGSGYWLAASDGGIFAFGVPFYGSTGGVNLVKPVVGISPDYTTGGYRLVASDGGVFDFHDPFYGSTGGVPLVEPIVGMASAG